MGAGQPLIAVSSWCLHRTIGLSWWDSPSGFAGEKPTWGNGTVPILDLPAEIARHGIRHMHLCHFHVASRDKGWLAEFRSAIDGAGVTLTMLLIDDGDITHPTDHSRDVDWIAGWIDTAAALGARSARVVAGKQKPTPETLALAVRGLKSLCNDGASVGVPVMTENWHDLLCGPDEVRAVMEGVGDQLGFLADFGNWQGAGKYDDLAAIMPFADDTHAKCDFPSAGVMNAEDFGRCLGVAKAARFDGPYTLIYDGPGDDEWAGIEMEAAFIRDYLQAKPERTRA